MDFEELYNREKYNFFEIGKLVMVKNEPKYGTSYDFKGRCGFVKRREKMPNIYQNGYKNGYKYKYYVAFGVGEYEYIVGKDLEGVEN